MNQRPRYVQGRSSNQRSPTLHSEVHGQEDTGDRRLKEGQPDKRTPVPTEVRVDRREVVHRMLSDEEYQGPGWLPVGLAGVD